MGRLREVCVLEQKRLREKEGARDRERERAGEHTERQHTEGGKVVDSGKRKR